MPRHFSRNKRMAEGFIRKHSYRRACHRALRDGCSVPYRRTNLPLSQAQASAGTYASASQNDGRNMHAISGIALPLQQSRRRQPRGGSDAKPLRVFSWNAGGLSQQLWAEFKEWLQQQCELDVIFIQETHWTTSSQFKVEGWTAISGGLPEPEQVRSPPAKAAPPIDQPSKPQRSAGVLTLLSPRIDSATIRWQDLHPGRAQEVHCEVRGQSVLLLNCYQYTKQRGMTDQDHYVTQGQVLSSLGKALSHLSQRTTPVLAGDFNSSLRPSPPCVGGVVPAGTSKQKPVQQQFQKFVQKNSLVALNTWQGKKAYTYTSPQGNSQIDFLFTTKYFAAQLARKVRVVSDFKLGAWRKGGRHRPLTTAIPLKKVWRHPLSNLTKPAIPS